MYYRKLARDDESGLDYTEPAVTDGAASAPSAHQIPVCRSAVNFPYIGGLRSFHCAAQITTLQGNVV
jgi:hypothetical protein